MLGGIGVVGLTGIDARRATGTGATLSVRTHIGTRQTAALELAYFGSLQSINVFGLDPNALLVGNGAQADFRVNLATETWQPYLIAGFGFRILQVSNADFNTSSVLLHDTIFEVPMGGGLAWRHDGLVLEGRLSYRIALGDQLLGTAGQSHGLDSWVANAFVGWEL